MKINNNYNSLIKKQEVTNLDNKVKLLVLLFGIMALIVMQVRDVNADIVQIGSITAATGGRVTNNTIIAGTTVTLRINTTQNTPDRVNFTLRVYYNTTASGVVGGTWTQATLAGIASNSTCTSNNCTLSGTTNGTMGVTFTVPSDLRGSWVRVRTAARNASTTFLNGTHRLSFDNTNPTLTINTASSAGNNQQTTDDTPLFRIDGDENMTSMQLSLAGRLYNMTRVDADTFEYTFLNAIPHGSYVYTATAGDYASNNNFQTSTFGINIKSGDRSPAQKQLVAEIAAGQGMFAGEGQPKEIAKTAGGVVVGGVIGGIIVPVIGIIPGAVVGGIIGFMF